MSGVRQRWRTPALLAVLVACLFPNSVLAAHPDRAVCVGAGPVLLQVFAAGVFVSRPGIVHAQAPDETAEETTVEDSQATTPAENTTTPAPLTCDENADVTNSGDTASNSPRRLTHTTLRSARLRGSLLTAARHRLRVPERLHWQRLRLRRLSCGDLQKQDGRRRLLPVRTCRCVHPRARAERVPRFVQCAARGPRLSATMLSQVPGGDDGAGRQHRSGGVLE